MLTVDYQAEEGFARLRLTGDLDALSVSRLRQASGALRDGLPLVIDLSSVHFIDGAGVGALVGVVQRTGDRGANTVLVAGASVAAALRQSGMDSVVALVETPQAAVAWLSSRQWSAGERVRWEAR